MIQREIRLLIIEDVEDHALLIVREVTKRGFGTSFLRVETREELQAALEQGGWDAVISDYNLPGFNGRDALRMVQEKEDVPFLLVSGAIGEELAAELIKAGAHGYIRKGNYGNLVPILERELAEAALRRERRETAQELARYREHLEELVHERTARLEETNAALLQSQRRLTLALEAAAMCTWRFDPDSRDRTWDDRCYALFHVAPDEPMTHQGFLQIVHPEDRDRLDAAIAEALEGRRSYNFEHRIIWPDGSVRWVMSRGEFTLEEGNPRVMTGVLLDVTEKKQWEAEVVKARQAAEAAARAKSDFLANMSHEIRTPLNGILGMTELLFDTELSQLQLQYLQMIRNSADILLSVVNDVLDFSKIEAGRLELEQVEVDLRETLEDVAQLVAVQAHRKNLELILDIETQLPDFFLGDPVRLRQVLTNLTGNAVKFTDRGEVIVRLKGTPCGEAGRWALTFSVTDTGIGIPQEKLEVLFTSFTQVDPSTTRSHGGTGLGLAIARKLVEQMGGRIWVESREGEGSTFAFELELPGFEREREAQSAATEIAGLRVLVLDDNETNRLVLWHWLSHKGAVVDTAVTGSEAVRKVVENASAGTPYQLALLDYNLPDIDGLQVADQLRRHFPIGELAIMMLTSDDIAEGARRAREMGMVAYLVKPVRMAALTEAMHRVRSFRAGEATVVREAAQEPEAPPTLPFCTRVLVVEDNPVNLTVAEAMLRRSGARVTAAQNGTEAVEAVAGARFEVVLMDAQMPVMDGFEATRTIRASGCDVPIIGLTALAMEGDRERCLEAGMDDYLPKPFTAETLLSKVSHWLRERPRPSIRLDEVMKQVGGNREILECVLSTFRTNADQQLTDVRRAVDTMDAAQIEKTAHRLKGALMAIGAERARCLAEQLEELARAQELFQVKPLQEQLSTEMTRVIKALGNGGGCCPIGEGKGVH